MATPKMNLKLLVDKKGQRVLFAEASKAFVDFLFHVFSLPLGTLIEFLGSEQMVGCLGKLKESIDIFNETYLQPDIDKDGIFNPKTAFNSNVFLLSYDAPADDQSTVPEKIYMCPNTSSTCYSCRSDCRSYATLYVDARCPGCGKLMNSVIKPVVPEKETAAEREVVGKKMVGGYVKEVVTYMVMDDLVVTPMSSISSITLINKFDVKDLSQLEEKMVSFGKTEGLKLLKASLTTDKVLTSMFLDNNNGE